jgi:LysM repeat protein
MADTLAAGASLTPGEYLTSPDGTYQAGLTTNGELVVRGGASGKVWSSGTEGKGVVAADLLPTGNLVLRSAEGEVWSTGSAGENPRMVIQDDRNLVIYGGDGTAVLWSPNCYVTDEEKAAAAPAPVVEEAPAPAPVVPAVDEVPPPPPAPEPRRYTVRSGDTLSKIAREFYGDAHAYMRIAEANGIADPNRIFPGQDLVIP